MRVLNVSTVRDWALDHPDAEASLFDWHSKCEAAHWSGPHDLRSFPFQPSFVGSDRIIFNVQGNRYRLICRVDYQRQRVFCLWFGTHRAYDDIDVATVPPNFNG